MTPTPALRTIQSDVHKLMAQILSKIDNLEQFDEPFQWECLARLADRLGELARNGIIHQGHANSLARLQEINRLAMGNYRPDPDPR